MAKKAKRIPKAPAPEATPKLDHLRTANAAPLPDPYYPPPPPAPKPKPTYGFECPKCACPLFRVTNTWGIRGAIRRARVCTHCGWTGRTMETFV
jgi:hypothetical protein